MMLSGFEDAKRGIYMEAKTTPAKQVVTQVRIPAKAFFIMIKSNPETSSWAR